MTPVQTSLKKNELIVFRKLQDGRKKHKSQFQIGQLEGTADIRKVLSKEIQRIGLMNYII